jgi:hypothetical protein
VIDVPPEFPRLNAVEKTPAPNVAGLSAVSMPVDPTLEDLSTKRVLAAVILLSMTAPALP